MSFGLLHLSMLLGLAGLGLPVLAHLLSKKKYDVVPWGAMQFLELGRNTRRRIRLEEILLMLLRMGVVAALVLGMARPWIAGGFLSRLVSTESRDVVLLIDGSASMGWEGKSVTPHAAAVQWVHGFLEDLRAGDSVAVFDCRDVLRPVIDPPTHDFALVRQKLNDLPPPAGSCNLVEAAAAALRLLNTTGNVSREIIFLTDGQARAWHPDEPERWQLLDDLRQQAAVPPKFWAVNVSGQTGRTRANFSLARLQLSRETAPPNLPVRIQTKLQHFGAEPSSPRKVFLEVDGQRIAEATLQAPSLPPGGEFNVQFERRFKAPGSHLLSVVLEPDNLPGDDRADAVVQVITALPVLLVDGDPQLDPTRSETFFCHAAFSATENETPLVAARTVRADQFIVPKVDEAAVVVLANVARVTADQATALAEYVRSGGGLLVAPGSQMHLGIYNQLLYQGGQGVLPGALLEQARAAEDPSGTRVNNASLEVPFLAPFRTEQGGDFTAARFTSFWKVRIPASAAATTAAATTASAATPGSEGAGESTAPVAQVLARFETGDPLLISREIGRGRVLLLTVPLDSDGSTLPAKQDFVPFLHELVFQLARGAAASRNVEAGQPLILAVPAGFTLAGSTFHGPGGRLFEPELTGDATHPTVRLNDTSLPGVYIFGPSRVSSPTAERGELFAVNFDRAESDLSALDEDEAKMIAANDRVQFITSLEEWKHASFSDASRTELWQLLLFAVLGLLVAELWMTHRLVQGGHTQDDADEPLPLSGVSPARRAHRKSPTASS